jgi:hypothetical protein
VSGIAGVFSKNGLSDLRWQIPCLMKSSGVEKQNSGKAPGQQTCYMNMHQWRFQTNHSKRKPSSGMVTTCIQKKNFSTTASSNPISAILFPSGKWVERNTFEDLTRSKERASLSLTQQVNSHPDLVKERGLLSDPHLT